MIKLAGMALQARLDLAQTAQAAKLRIQHRDQMSPRFQDAIVPISIVFFHKPIEHRPRNRFQKPMKNDILMLHGVDPFRVQMIRNQLEASRINAVHFFKHRPCQTPVGQARQ